MKISLCKVLIIIQFMLQSAAQAQPILAHRGMAQTFSTENLTATTCTASRIHPPSHPYLENTLDSMAAAFAAGAEVVELDIHPTTDGRFAVFHDWTLNCRTNGTGVTRSQSMAYLKTLDIGYGYTADGGKTYPFRGLGIGKMPSLKEVLKRFPDQQFLINFKSNDPLEGETLAALIATLPQNQQRQYMVYGGEKPVAAFRQRLPNLLSLNKQSLQNCLFEYIAYGWTGQMPAACHQRLILVPINIGPWLWGWPHDFVQRMEAGQSKVFVTGPFDGRMFTTGIDSLEQLKQLPNQFKGGIWTNRIDLIGPAIKSLSTLKSTD